MNEITRKLKITTAELNSLYTPCPVEGFTGKQVESEIRERFHLPETETCSLGEQLCEAGVLTNEEAAWLDED